MLLLGSFPAFRSIQLFRLKKKKKKNKNEDKRKQLYWERYSGLKHLFIVFFIIFPT